MMPAARIVWPSPAMCGRKLMSVPLICSMPRTAMAAMEIISPRLYTIYQAPNDFASWTWNSLARIRATVKKRKPSTKICV